MGKRTSATSRRARSRFHRSGFTLVEAIFASTLLAVTVVAISGVISASYAQDQYAEQRRAALTSGSQLLNEVTALPIDATDASSPSIMGYSSYVDQAAIEQLTSVVNSTGVVATANDAKSAKRSVKVERKSSLNGASSPTGDFAVVGVTVENGEQNVTIKRLVTAAESTATR